MLAIEKFLGIWTLIGSVEIQEELPEVDADWNYWFENASSEQIQSVHQLKGLLLLFVIKNKDSLVKKKEHRFFA